MSGWELLPKIVLLLGAAAAAGLLLRKLRQSVIVGYLLAGVLLGPTGLGLVRSDADVEILSELGVALLLFSIGLEFSLRRLRQFGSVAAGAGSIQLALTSIAVTLAAHFFGLAWSAAGVLGMAFAMSSTALVLRGLTDRAELDSTPGRNAIGMLLFQDLAVLPVLIAADALAKAKSDASWVDEFGIRVSFVFLFIVIASLAGRFILPRLLSAAALSGSRDLPVVIAACTSVGAAWGAHSLGFSPSLGAFVAGMVLAESPFATQIRADLTPLSAVFITLFFASVGTAVYIPPDFRSIALLIAAAGAVMFLKAVITSAAVYVVQRSLRAALVTGVLISQVGEFTFVVVQNAYRNGLIPAETFQLTLGIALITLIATPYAMSSAPIMVARALRRVPAHAREALETGRSSTVWRRVIVIGYGPAGQRVVASLRESDIPFLVLEMNPNTVSSHRSEIPIELGDAIQREVLQHIGVGQSLAVIVTIPDPTAAGLIAQAVGRLAPGVPVVVRCRYHQYKEALEESGADRIVDEEDYVGARLAEEAIDVSRVRMQGG